MSSSRNSRKVRMPPRLWKIDHCTGQNNCDVIRPNTRYNNAGLEIPNYAHMNELIISEVQAGSSDARLKKDISDISKEDVEKLSILSPKQYRFKNAKRNNIHFGLIAQEVEKVFPNIVYQTGDGKKAVCYLEIIPLLLLKVKDLERQIQELK